jgi:DNA-directed RNA polymerase II subunit RPB2
MVGYNDDAYDDQAVSELKPVFEIDFGLVYLSKPTTVENDGTVTNMFPYEARLRNLTYSAPLYVDVVMHQCQVLRDVNIGDPSEDMGEPVSTEHARKEFLGYVPIMLRSFFCVLSDKDDADLSNLGECIYDQGGYFVINGSEKVVIAQERLSNNHVYAFRKKQPSKFSWVIETRSQVENSTRPVSTLYIQMYSKGGRGAIEGNQVRSTLPYPNGCAGGYHFPSLGLRGRSRHYRARGVRFDRWRNDGSLSSQFGRSLCYSPTGGGFGFSGRRGSARDVTKDDRIRYATAILQKEFVANQPVPQKAPPNNTAR